MPLMYLHYPEGTFTQEGLDALAAQITRDGEELEGLPLTDYVLSTTWVYSQAYPRNRVYHGGKSEGANFISLLINVIQGGYNETTKKELIARVTNAVAQHGNLPDNEPRRVYVIIREVAESNWGSDGKPISLEELRDPPKDAKPL
jgi:4-oxalocrotonate tautomerase family enzyme